MSVTPAPIIVNLTDLLTTIFIPLLLGISGWVAFFYQYFSDKPRIRGKILQVMYGQFPNPIKPSEQLTSFVLFLYLTNTRKNAVHLQRYDLEVDYGKGFKKMQIVRGIPENMNISFESNSGKISIPNFNKGLIYKHSKPIEFGVPFYGYLLFAGDIKYYQQKGRRFRISITDVFDHKHVFIANPEKHFIDIFNLQELFGIKIPVNAEIKDKRGNMPTNQSINIVTGNEVT